VFSGFVSLACFAMRDREKRQAGRGKMGSVFILDCSIWVLIDFHFLFLLISVFYQLQPTTAMMS